MISKLGREAVALFTNEARRSLNANAFSAFSSLKCGHDTTSPASVRYDPEVTAAVELIRRKACEGISSADVVTAFKCSRRMAEVRFRQIVGHSILDEIQSVKLERAKELLSNTGQDIASTANFCGFKAANALWKFFRQEKGLSPTE